VDFLVTSPPYWVIHRRLRTADAKEPRPYSDIPQDLGNIERYVDFLEELGKIFAAAFRVLKPGAYCIVNIMGECLRSVLKWFSEVRKDEEKKRSQPNNNPIKPYPLPCQTFLQGKNFKETKTRSSLNLPRTSHLDPFSHKASLWSLLQANPFFCQGKFWKHPLSFHLALQS